ncbi:MAG: P1 family peptidase [Lachnospiraceae bacterium]|nr:P1 family peptidase [Lachnospiraceae bacterium]
MQEISIKELEGYNIGQVEDKEGATGCTVLVCREGMRAGIDVRGGGPASRDSELLNPIKAAQVIHGIVLAGGSAFGLSVATGAMNYLEENDIGFDVSITKVPLVVQADIFDLTVGDCRARPNEKMGYEAAKRALEKPNYMDGNYGAGCGATVGKILGMDYCMKSGIGSYAVQIGELKIGAIVVVNSLGDIFDHKTGKQIAGLLTEDKNSLRNTLDFMAEKNEVRDNKFVSNTTIGIIMTNADFAKPELCKIAGMSHNGYARAINPVHTSVDGDTIFAVANGKVKADIDVVGTVAAQVMSEAIIKALESAESAYGFKAMCDMK